MGIYWTITKWFLFFVVNTYAIYFSLAGMNLSSDLGFISGVSGLLVLAVTDYLILKKVLKVYPFADKKETK